LGEAQFESRYLAVRRRLSKRGASTVLRGRVAAARGVRLGDRVGGIRGRASEHCRPAGHAAAAHAHAVAAPSALAPAGRRLAPTPPQAAAPGTRHQQQRQQAPEHKNTVNLMFSQQQQKNGSNFCVFYILLRIITVNRMGQITTQRF